MSIDKWNAHIQNSSIDYQTTVQTGSLALSFENFVSDNYHL